MCITLSLSGCAGQGGGLSGREETPQTAAESSKTAEEISPADVKPTEIFPSAKENFAKMEIDPLYDFDPDEMRPEDFGKFFEMDYDSETSAYLIGEGTPWEREVTKIKGGEDGAAIYVVAGVHGDEKAAWLTGNLLKKISIKAGTLYVLSPANKWGAAAEPATRYITGDQDLNRSFPGKADGTEAEQIAAQIFEDIKEKKPDFVFDLHEARLVSEGRDFLGSSLIFTDLSDKMDMLIDMILETQMGTLCRQQFDYLGPGPEGSINTTVSTELSIPTITVETFRGYQMEHRISDQLDIVQYVLREYGLVQ